LVTGRADDAFPGRQKRLAGVAHLLGYEDGMSQVLVEDYRKAARHARGVVDRVFYGFE
jgi:glutamate-ammonia-ligase adenylyltransferase